MSDERPFKRARVEHLDPGDRKAEPTPTIEHVRDVVMQSLDELSATPSKRAHWLTERLPTDLFVHVLSFMPILARTRVYRASRPLRDRFSTANRPQAKAEPAWGKELVLTHEDESTWYHTAMVRHVPWLPDLKSVKRLVVTAPSTDDGDLRDETLLRSPVLQQSVTNLTVRAQVVGNMDWPYAADDLRGQGQWPHLTQLRFLAPQGTSFQSLLPGDDLRTRLLDPLSKRSGVVLTALRVEQVSYAWSLDVARTYLTATPNLWIGLEKLGLCMHSMDDTGWALLTKHCPKLVKLVMRGEENHLTDATLQLLGRAWPKMRYFAFHVVNGTIAITPSKGLRALTTWSELEFLRLTVVQESNEAAPALSHAESDAMATCIAAWPKLRTLRLQSMATIVTMSILAAFNRHCPQIEWVGFRMTSIPEDWKGKSDSTVEAMREFHRTHRNLHCALEGSKPRPWLTVDEMLELSSQYNHDFRWFNASRVAAGERFLEMGLRSLRKVLEWKVGVWNINDDSVLLALVDPTQQRPVDAPRDWTPRSRPMEHLQLMVNEWVQVSDAGLEALAQTCPSLHHLSIAWKDDAAATANLAQSETKVSVRQIQRLLRACPKLTEFVLDIAPLHGVDRLTDDLFLVTALQHPISCHVRFRLGPFHDVSDESNQWYTKHTNQVANLPGVRVVSVKTRVSSTVVW